MDQDMRNQITDKWNEDALKRKVEGKNFLF